MNFMEQFNLTKDAPLMQAWINQYSHRDSMPVAEYLNTWHDAKSEMLLPLMDNQLIYREKICYKTSASQMDTEVDHWLNNSKNADVLHTIYFWVSKIVVNGYNLWNLQDFFDDYHTRKAIVSTFDSAMGYYAMSRNAISLHSTQTSISWVCPENGRRITINKGQKPFRLFTSFIKNFEGLLMSNYGISAEEIERVKEKLEALRIEHSQLFNNTRIVGNLCISIHPMDYITMSDNDYNWSSCMSWTEGGCYHAGTIEMMNSPCVVIAYIDGSKEWYPCGKRLGTWSNKKWRELFIVDRNFISGIKSYPYDNSDLESIVLDRIAAMAKKAFGWEYCNENSKSKNNAMHFTDCAVYFSTHLMYNDTENNEFVYRVAQDIDYAKLDIMHGHNKYFNYSGHAYCTVCGYLIENEAGTVCMDHSEYIRCDDCGELIYRDEACFDDDGNAYCSYCYDRLFSACDECYSFHYNDSLTAIHLVTMNPRYSRELEPGEYVRRPYRYEMIKVICDECLNNLIKNDYVVKAHNEYDETLYVITEKYYKEHKSDLSYVTDKPVIPTKKEWEHYRKLLQESLLKEESLPF